MSKAAKAHKGKTEAMQDETLQQVDRDMAKENGALPTDASCTKEKTGHLETFEESMEREAQATAESKRAEEETRVEALTEELQALKEDLAQMKDQNLRLAAEYDNFRKRSRQEKDELYAKSVNDVSALWLPVMDNLDRALDVLDKIEHEESKLAADGVEKVYKQGMDVLSKLGIDEIPSLGETFDPVLHEAISHVEDESKGENEIVEVFQKGYRQGEKVLRHSVVRVAN